MAKAPKNRNDMPITPLSRPRIASTGKTGSWRTFRPVANREKCTKCQLCWIFCPEGCIELDADNLPNINYDYCKGCGVCANECPLKLIIMKREEET